MAVLILKQHDFDLRGLECPTTWGTGDLPLQTCEDMKDKLCLVATPWAAAVERFKLSWFMWANSRRDEARALLVGAYMRLLPHPALHQGCGLISEYRRALRLVLDSTWATMRVSTITDKTDVDNLERFIRAVEPLSKMDKKQRAAVYAIRGRLSQVLEDQKWFRKAINLSPGEGEWRYLLGWVLQEGRKCRGTPSAEEISLFREAYRHRKNPDTVLRLARTLADCGPSKWPEAEALVDEALTLFPDHPRALTSAANILYKLRGHNPTSLRLVRDLYEKAQTFTGQRAFIQMKLSSLCQMTGELWQAERHYEAAMRLNPSAVKHYTARCEKLVNG